LLGGSEKEEEPKQHPIDGGLKRALAIKIPYGMGRKTGKSSESLKWFSGL
jgi:hypothetical protein